MGDVSKRPLSGEPVSFDFQLRTRLVYGPGCLDRVGSLVKEYGGNRVLLVTDAGIVAAGHAKRTVELLEAAGLTVVLFDDAKENPTTECVDKCVKVAKDNKIDFIVGLGGGSSMDTAKGCNFILTNGGRMQDYWGVGKATKPMLPLIAIPTTAGTGSECQSFALIADKDTHSKMACGDPKAAAKVAILDPELTVSQPARVTACTGIDAIAHAVETAVTKKRNPISILFSHRAFQLAVESFPVVMAEPQNVDARGKMLLAAAYAGTAIEGSMLGAAHSAANPLTAHFGIIHGQAVGAMLPSVVRFNGHQPEARRAYRELAIAGGLVSVETSPEDSVQAIACRLEELLVAASMSASLGGLDVNEALIPTLALEASGQWTANFNPRPVAEGDFETLYRAAMHEPVGHATA